MRKIILFCLLFSSLIFGVKAGDIQYLSPIASTGNPLSFVNNATTWQAGGDLFCEDNGGTFEGVFDSPGSNTCQGQGFISYSNNGTSWISPGNSGWCPMVSITCFVPIEGCTHSIANNYDPLADTDDGTCIYDGAGVINVDFQQGLGEDVFTKDELLVFYGGELAICLLIAIVSYTNKIVGNRRPLLKMF